MISCQNVQQLFSRYLDGDVPGTEMLEMTGHLEACSECRGQFSAWKRTQQLLTELGPAAVPADLALRLRVAVSQQRRRSVQERLGRLRVRWENTARPLLLRAAAGMACAVLLTGTAALLMGTVTSPDPVEASDTPLEGSSGPRFLYSSFAPAPAIGDASNPLILQVFVDTGGRVYDYRVLSGALDPATRDTLNNVLLFSAFAPARYFDQPIPGSVVMSFTGVSVKG